MQPGMMQPGMMPMQPMGMMQPQVIVMQQPGMPQHKCAYCEFGATGKCDEKVACIKSIPCGNYFCADHREEVRVRSKNRTTSYVMCTECAPKFRKENCKRSCCVFWIFCCLFIVIGGGVGST